VSNGVILGVFDILAVDLLSFSWRLILIWSHRFVLLIFIGFKHSFSYFDLIKRFGRCNSKMLKVHVIKCLRGSNNHFFWWDDHILVVVVVIN